MRTNRFKTLRAIHPNAGVEAWYHRELEHIVMSMCESVESSVFEAYKPLSTAIVGDASPTAFMKKTLSKWGDLWTRKLSAMSEKLADQFAERSFNATQTSMRAAFKAAGFTVKFAPTTRSIEAYRAVVAENVGLIKSIPAQYLKEIESHVWQSAMNGGDLHALSAKLKKSYATTAKRAALIARDQNAKAKAVIERTRRDELGITHAIWQHSAGGKEPRPTHVVNDGKRFNLKTGWYDPDANGKGKGEYVWPGTLVNCRCTSRALIPAFD